MEETNLIYPSGWYDVRRFTVKYPPIRIAVLFSASSPSRPQSVMPPTRFMYIQSVPN